MASRHDQEPPKSYVDGVRVKISEKYKPPPRINLAMSYAQRLTLNKQIQDTIPQYEFLLEKTVAEKMKEWRKARTVMFQQLSDRVKSARSAEEVKREDRLEFPVQEDEVEVSTTQSLYSNSGPSQSMLLPTKATENWFSTILTPIPLKNHVSSQKSLEKSSFNISDFDPDTSSPFDNMELKSINDMEELAQVLKGEQKSKSQLNYNAAQLNTSSYSIVGPGTYTSTIPNSTNYIQPSLYSTTNGYYFQSERIQPNQTFNPTYNYSSYSCSPVQDSKSSTIPDIMRTLQNELDHTHIDNTRNVKIESAETFSKAETKSDESLDEFSSLPKSMQDMSKSISSMGFPLSRVARVCKILGNDQKKVVEHLLAMSDLLDLGFPEGSVSNALVQCDNDRDKALDILIS